MTPTNEQRAAHHGRRWRIDDMGMFDYVECHHPLPDAPPKLQGERFQTKDFEDRLLLYIITEDGRLLVETFDHYDVVDRGKGPLGFQLQRAGERTEEVPFHGDFNFYTSVGDPNTITDWNSPDVWFEYTARFTEGRLTWIKRVEAAQ